MDGELKTLIEHILKKQKSLSSTISYSPSLDINTLKQSGTQLLSQHTQDCSVQKALLNHYFNATLWSLEDKARDPKALDCEIAAVKRKIDKVNQLRNDQVEVINELFLNFLPPLNQSAPIFSETPGSIIDRLSILNLKLYYTKEQLLDKSSDYAHLNTCHKRTQILNDQISDLFQGLIYLINKVSIGEMSYRPYYQLKMYNDANFNPYLSNKARPY